MYKGLYDNFKHWFHGGQVYFYSDSHFSDEEMKLIRHNYISDEEQIKRINSKIGKLDTLVILGDVGNKEWLKRIRGYKVLILGNHDSGASTYAGYVDEIYEGALIISEKIILSHEPLSFDFALNIHGHDHSMRSKADNKHYNVCAEHINYTPICLKQIIESGMLKKIPTIHRAVIDEATVRKKCNNLKKAHPAK